MTITVTHVSKTINRKPVIIDFSFEWRPGEIIGLVGRNGVGKTTLMRTLSGQYHLDDGTVTIDGATTPQSHQALFYLDGEGIFFKRWSLAQIEATFALAYPHFDRARFAALMRQYGLTNPRYLQLSKGYQALIRVGLAIASNAPYVLLDEPFDGLDVLIRRQIVDLVIDTVADGTRTVMIASHDLVELDGLADRILFLKAGHLVHDDALEDLRRRAIKRQLVFRQKQLPEVVRAHGQVLAIQGRVATVLFRDFTPDVAAELAAVQPVLNEPLPLHLTDLFVAEFKEGS